MNPSPNTQETNIGIDAGFTPSCLASSEWFQSVGSLLGAAGRGLLLTDTSGCIQQSNERFSELTGYATDEIVGNNPRMFQSGNTASSTYRIMWNELSSGRSWRGVLQNRRKNGSTFLEDITISPLKSPSGEIHSFMALMEPIDCSSPRARASGSWSAGCREELEPFGISDQDLVQEANHWVARGIAHEVNNALTGIIGNCSLAERETERSSKVHQRLEKISSISYGLHAFSNRLSLCAGLPQTLMGRIDLNQQIIDGLDELETTRDISTVVCRLSEYPVLVQGAAELIQVLVKELVSNALESESKATSDISVSVTRVLREGAAFAEDLYSKDFGLASGEVACIEVTDSGHGMEPFLLALSAELFFSTKPTHAGLGLPAVEGIVRSHHGALEVRSNTKLGTRVRVFLPLSSH